MIDNTTSNFLTAVEKIMETGLPMVEFCRVTEIDRRNLCRLIKDPEHHYPRPQWMTAICRCYNVSPKYILLGKGGIFNAR